MVNGASKTDQEMTILAERFYSATVGTVASTNEQEVYDVARLLDGYRSYYHLTNGELQNRFNMAVEEEILEHGGDLDSYQTNEMIEFRDSSTGKMTEGEVKRFTLTQAILGEEMSGRELEYSLRLYGYGGAPRDIIGGFVADQKAYLNEPIHYFVETIIIGGATTGGLITLFPIVSTITVSTIPQALKVVTEIGLINVELILLGLQEPENVEDLLDKAEVLVLSGSIIAFGLLCKNSYVRIGSMVFETSMFMTRQILNDVIDRSTAVDDKHAPVKRHNLFYE